MHICGMFDGEKKDHSTSNLTTFVRFSPLELAVEGRLETRAVAKRRRPVDILMPAVRDDLLQNLPAALDQAVPPRVGVVHLTDDVLLLLPLLLRHGHHPPRVLVLLHRSLRRHSRLFRLLRFLLLFLLILLLLALPLFL